MAQRATGFAKRPTAAATPSAAPPPVEETARVALPPVALKLAPRVFPYKKHGRLTLRIERMPQGSRLSAGRNNGNSSWSLTVGDLEDLQFYAAEGARDLPTLALRITGDDGETLALLELPLGQSEQSAEPTTVVNSGAVEQIRKLHEELARANAQAAAQEVELAKARASWKAEEEARLAVAKAKWQEDTATAVNEARGQTVSLEGRHTAEILRLRQEVGIVRKSLIDCEDELIRTKAEFAREQSKLGRDSSETLAQARMQWEAEEAARYKKADALWREQTARAVAEAKASLEARSPQDDAQVSRLRDELVTLRNTLAEQDKALAAARLTAEKARLDAQREVMDAVAKAEAKAREAELSLRANGAAQISEAEMQLRKEHAAVLTDANARAERAEAALRLANVSAARDEALLSETRARADRAEASLVQATTSASHKDGALAEANARAERAEAALAQASAAAIRNDALLSETKGRAERADAALLDAKARADSALATANARIEQTETALNETTTRAVTAETALAEMRALAAGDKSQQEIERLRGEGAAAEARFKAREQEYAQARAEMEASYVRERQDIVAAHKSAERAWHEALAEQVADAVRQHGEDQSAALAEAVSRYEAAESALAALRIQSGDFVHRQDSDADRLRDENVLLKAELHTARALLERHGLDDPDANTRAPASKRKFVEEKEGNSGFRLVRDLGLAAAVAASIFFVLPRAVPLLPYDWQVAIAGLSGQVATLMRHSPQAVKVAAAPTAPAEKARSTAVVVHGANLRAKPSSKAAVVMMLNRGVHVSLGETRGSWTEATIFDGADLRRGWVFSAYLKNSDPTQRQ